MSPRPGLGRSTLHLAGLWTVAVAMPQFSFLSGGEALVLFGWEPLDIVAYALALVIVPPALLGALEGVVGRFAGEGWRWRLHLALVGALAAVLAGVLLQQIDREIAAAWYLPAVLAGVATAFAYARSEAVRSFAGFLAFAPVVALVIFFTGSGVAPLVFPEERAEVEFTAKAERTPMVVIVFDELPTGSLLDRSGGLDRASYPGFAELARSATWYPNASAIQDSTLAAVPGVLTGERGDPNKPPSSAAYPHTLFDLLGPSHEVLAFEQFRLCPPSVCERDDGGFPGRVVDQLPYLGDAALDSTLPSSLASTPPGANVFGRGAGRLGFESLDELERVRSENPFLFIHSYLPHSPWNYLPSGQTVADAESCCLSDLFPGREKSLGGIDGVRLSTDPVPVRVAQQRHLSQVRYSDRLLGELITKLRAAGLYERALMVVTADHGVNFAPGESYRELTRDNAESVLGVPLFVKRPNQRRGGIAEAHVQTADVVPTVAAELGIDVPWELEGFPAGDAEADRDVIAAISDVTGEEFEFDPAALDRRRLALAREVDSRFGAGRGIQLYEQGPAPELLGRALPRGGRVTGAIANADAFADVDPEADAIPAEVAGTVPGARPGDAIAIGLNGRVVATTWAYDSEGTMRFEARIPPAALREGRNEVAISRVRADG